MQLLSGGFHFSVGRTDLTDSDIFIGGYCIFEFNTSI